MSTAVDTEEDIAIVKGIFDRVAADLGMIVDRHIKISQVTTERLDTRPAGLGRIHISFKLGFKHESETLHGCALIPLPDAIALASYLMMIPDQGVVSQRDTTELDRPSKEAMLELGNFISGAADSVLRKNRPEIIVRSEGCQGVRADVRPAFPFEEGAELVVGRARTTLHDFPEFDFLLLIPVEALHA